MAGFFAEFLSFIARLALDREYPAVHHQKEIPLAVVPLKYVQQDLIYDRIGAGRGTGQGRAAPCPFSSAALRAGQGSCQSGAPEGRAGQGSCHRAAPRGQGRAGALSFNDLFASILTVPVQKIKIPTQHPNSLAQQFTPPHPLVSPCGIDVGVLRVVSAQHFRRAVFNK